MQRRISYFDVDWNRREQTGGIRLAFDDRSFHDLRPLALDEISLICNMLRAEKPVYFDTETEILSTIPDARRS